VIKLGGACGMYGGRKYVQGFGETKGKETSAKN
jgi:hypothetical protein